MTFNGRDCFVAPAVLLVGNNVLNGSRGPLLYPTDECAKNPGAWNNIPITNGHPTDEDGNAISARDPKTLEKWQLGTTFNDQWDGQKRTVDMYYDAEWTRNKSPETYQALLNNQPFDLSTGLGTKNHPVQNGSHINGTPYTHVARDYTPDHVASLVSQRGACDRSMGCGVNVTNGECQCEDCTTNAKDKLGHGSDKKSIHMQTAEELVDSEQKRTGITHEPGERERLIKSVQEVQDRQTKDHEYQQWKIGQDALKANPPAKTNDQLIAERVTAIGKADRAKGTRSVFKGPSAAAMIKAEAIKQLTKEKKITSNEDTTQTDNAKDAQGHGSNKHTAALEMTKKANKASHDSGHKGVADGRSEAFTAANKNDHATASAAHLKMATKHEESNHSHAALMHRTAAKAHDEALTANQETEGLTVPDNTNEEPSLLRRIAEKLGVVNAKDAKGHGSNKRGTAEKASVAASGVKGLGKEKSKQRSDLHYDAAQAHHAAAVEAGNDKDLEAEKHHYTKHKEHMAKAVAEAKNHDTSLRGIAMNKKESITYLTTNCSCHKGKDKVLNEYTDEELALMVKEHESLTENTLVINSLREIPDLKDLEVSEMSAVLNKAMCPDPEEPDEDDGIPVPPKKKATMNTEADWLASAPQSIKDTVAFAASIKDAAKKQLVDRVVNTYAKNDAAKKALRPTYEGMTINQLQVIVDNIAVPTENHEEFVERDVVMNYLGNAGGYSTPRNSMTNNLVDEDDILLPSYEGVPDTSKK